MAKRGITAAYAARRAFLGRGLACAAMLAATGGRAMAQSAAASRMADGAPSATAQGAALLRALHQVVDHPLVLEDPLALEVLGSGTSEALQSAADRVPRGMRAAIVMRSRYAEDRLAAAVTERGVRQYVLLGAGLDTFACRNPHEERSLQVFEVDHPATQRWKRGRLEAANIVPPRSLTFVPVDFETQTLAQELRRAGFRFDRPAFFSMLGVAIYLTEPAVMDTMRFVSSLPSGSEIVFSFSVPDGCLSEAAQAARARSMARAASLGEPWISFFEPAVLEDKLRAAGFGSVEILDPERANRMYFSSRGDGLRLGNGGHMAAARV